MSDPDHRLRAALTDLGHAAQERVRPAGSAGVPAAGRRRRRAVQTATGVLALVLAGGGTAVAAAQLTYDASTGASPAASATCGAQFVTIFLDREAPAEQRRKLEAILAGPEFAAVDYEGGVGGVQVWNVTLRCSDDFPALKLRFDALPVLGYTWSAPGAAVPPWVAASASASVSARPEGSSRSTEPARICNDNGCRPASGPGSWPASGPGSWPGSGPASGPASHR